MFNELQIPRNLQKSLPYSLKPKFGEDKKARHYEDERVTVDVDSRERKKRNLMKMLSAVAEEKEQRLEAEKSRRVQELIKRQAAGEEKKFRRQKEARRQVARALSMDRARKEKMAARGGGGANRGRKRARNE